MKKNLNELFFVELFNLDEELTNDIYWNLELNDELNDELYWELQGEFQRLLPFIQ